MSHPDIILPLPQQLDRLLFQATAILRQMARDGRENRPSLKALADDCEYLKFRAMLLLNSATESADGKAQAGRSTC